jgi:large subunit ribosomal protein L22
MAKAYNKNIGYSAYKMRRIIDLIRSKSVNDARLQLSMLGTPAAKEILKILNSAIANASNNESISEDELYVTKIFADNGPRLNRFIIACISNSRI